MTESFNLKRFVTAQEGVYEQALAEINAGRKNSHWMWFMFPQIAGLGFSETSKFYAIKNIEEAEAYLQHPVLGARLIAMSKALLHLDTNDPITIFGTVDSLKFQSSMTLFSLAAKADLIFEAVLDKYYGGLKDRKTIQLLKEI